MRPPRRPRRLSGEEARLWGEIAKLVTPLRGRAIPEAPARPAPASPPAPPPALPAGRPLKAPPTLKPPPKRPAKLAELAASVAPPAASRPPATVVAPPRPPGLERRERVGLRRGSLSIEARLDLHGLYQADAHAALVGFVLRARAAGHARVLVVTGKGSDEAFSERGVLRRAVPHWLRGPELRALVLGFEEAARHHGGAGALYVRLRRR